MSRKNKIMVSVVGIVIVTLALLGITYGYYLTRIQGNTNTNSISITTANLELVYGDENGIVVDANIVPGKSYIKEFTVTNNGTSTVNDYIVGLIDVVNTLSRVDDLKISMTCTATSSVEGVNPNACIGIPDTNPINYPKTNSILVTNSIEVGTTHTYKLTVTYLETNTDQSVDMGSTINGKVQIYGNADTIEITGEVIGYTTGDYVQINSEPQKSEIASDGTYKLVGVEAGNHTLTVRYKDENGEEQIRATKEITIGKGSAVSVSGENIVITEKQEV